MTDEPSSRELSALLKDHDQEFEDWKQKRLQVRLWIFWVSCLALFAALTVWLHEALRPVFCTSYGTVCQEYYTGNSWHLMSWATVANIAGAAMSLVANVAMIIVWFSRFSRRLHVRGPMVETEDRRAFLWRFAWITAFTIVSGAMSATFLIFGR